MHHIPLILSHYCIWLILFFTVTACTSTSGLTPVPPTGSAYAEAGEAGISEVINSQKQSGPERLGLVNMEEFRSPAKGWAFAGNAYTNYPGESLSSDEGTGVLIFDGRSDADSPLVTQNEFADTFIELEFMLEGGACFSLMIQGRYEIRHCSHPNDNKTRLNRFGTIHYGKDSVIPPLVDASRAPGVWQELVVEFYAPQFNRSGNKTANARIERVLLNGEIIHRAIELPGIASRSAWKDESAKGPLTFGIDAGSAAFRNIGLYGDQDIKLEDLRYEYHEENLDDDDQLAQATPIREDATTGISAALASRGNNFALSFSGNIVISASGTYHFDSISRGDVTMEVDGQIVLQPTPPPVNPLDINLTDNIEGTLELEAGKYPFTLQYKKMQPGASALSVFVEGPGIRRQAITSNDGGWRPAIQAVPIRVEPDRRAVVFRSHISHQNQMVLNAVSVGDPEGIHYSIDVGNAALIQVWNDEFLDAGPIWTGRGMDPDTRMVAGIRVPDSKVSFSGRPSVAFLKNRDEPWPDSTDNSYRFLGYNNDEMGRPSFSYRFGNLKVDEKLRPGKSEYGSSLTREFSMKSTEGEIDAWVLLAEGAKIEQRGEGVFSVDDTYFVEVQSETDVFHRRIDGREELLVYFSVHSHPVSFTTTLIW